MKHLDLFSGIGGFSLGLEAAGMETVAFVENDEDCQSVLSRHWCDVPIYGDIKEVDFNEFEDIDIITAGFPCTDASTAQEYRTGTSGERTGLYREVVRAIRVVRPRYTIMENVAGLLDTGMGNVLGDLVEAGQDIEWDCISASDCGAPHERERLWIVSNPAGERLPGSRECFKSIHKTPDAYREADSFVDAVQRNTLPFVCDRHDGVSRQVAESGLKQLGNSVVPQITYAIGKAIMEQEKAS